MVDSPAYTTGSVARSIHRRFPPFLAGLILLFAIGLAGARTEVPPTAPFERIDVGIAGFYKNGYWTPLRVRFAHPATLTDTSVLRVETVDSDGVATVYRFPVRTDSDVQTVYVKLGRAAAPLSVALENQPKNQPDDAGLRRATARQTLLPTGRPEKNVPSKEKSASRFTEPLPVDRPIYLVVGDENIGLREAVAGLHLQESRRPVVVRIDDLARLPDHPDGYDAVDMVVLTTSQPDMFVPSPSSAARISALETWMVHGGHVFLLAGKDAGPLVAPGGPLERFFPGKYMEMTDLRQGDVLQLFARGDRVLTMSGSEDTPFLRMPRFRSRTPTTPSPPVPPGTGNSTEGAVVLRDADQPLVVRAARGFGRLTYFGGDLNTEPLLSWQDRPLLVSAILGWNTDSAPQSARRSVSLLHFGYGDMAGQLRSSLDAFEGTQVVPVSILFAIMGVYIAVVGGLDWLLVHKLLKKPVLTWLTFPLWVALFGVLAYTLGFGNRLDRPTVNRVELIDLDLAQGHERLSTWYALYSPVDARYSLRSGCHDSGALTWNGLSGSGLGGMAPKTYAPGVWSEGYEIVADATSVRSGREEGDSLLNMPLAVRSTKALFAQSHRLHGPLSASRKHRLPAPLREEQGVSVGTITNPFGARIEDARLAFGRWIIEIGTIDAGGTVEISLKNPRHELKDVLYESRPENAPFARGAVAYAPQSRDPLYILRAMSFHEAVGGYEAVGLHNEYQGRLDVSGLLKTDRAVLVGKLLPGADAADADLDDAESSLSPGNRTTVVRLVLPVVLAEVKETVDTGGRGLLDSADKTIQEEAGFDTMKSPEE